MTAIFQNILETCPPGSVNIIDILQKIQERLGYIPETAVDWFADRLDVPASRFFGVITFYPKFRMRPAGTNTLTVCCGAACHIKGAEAIFESARSALQLGPDDDTSADRLFTLEKATCVGACNIAPITILNKAVSGQMNPGKINDLIERIREENRPGA